MSCSVEDFITKLDEEYGVKTYDLAKLKAVVPLSQKWNKDIEITDYTSIDNLKKPREESKEPQVKQIEGLTLESVKEGFDARFKKERLAAYGWAHKENGKMKVATQSIASGSKGSTAGFISKIFAEVGLNNTGKYTADDVIFLSANGKRRNMTHVVDNQGKLINGYENIEKAIKAGASFLTDTRLHIEAGDYDNIGEKEIAAYLKGHGYTLSKTEFVGKKQYYAVWTKKEPNTNQNEDTTSYTSQSEDEELRDKFIHKSRKKDLVTNPVTKKTDVWYGSGSGLNAWISNRAYRPFEYRGNKYVSVEHAYQTNKGGIFQKDVYSNPVWNNGGIDKSGPKPDTRNNANFKLMEELIKESIVQNNMEDDFKALLDDKIIVTHNNARDNDIWKTQFPISLMNAIEALSGSKRPKINEDKKETKEPEGSSRPKINEDKKDIQNEQTSVYGHINFNKNTQTPLQEAYATGIELGTIEINTVEELMEFTAKYNDSIDGTTKHNGYDIAKATEWYQSILGDMSKNGFKFQPIKINVVDKIMDENGEYNGTLGFAFTRKDEDGYGRINLVRNANHRIVPALTVVHEYTHIITLAALENDPAARARIRRIMDKARLEMEVDGKLPIDVEYAFTNEGEFVAEVMANPELQRRLDKISGSGKIVDQVRKIFNATMKRFKGNKQTLLTESLGVIYELQLNNANSTKKDGKSNTKAFNKNTELLLGDENAEQIRKNEMDKIGEAIDHNSNVAETMKNWLNNHARARYNGGRTGRVMDIKTVEVDEKTLDTKIVFRNNTQYTFTQGQDGSKYTKNGTTVLVEGLNYYTNQLMHIDDIINSRLGTIANGIITKMQECK